MENIKYINDDILNASADVIVNASNGCGWMGGKRSATKKYKGIAESLNFKTNGTIEKEAMIKARKFKSISSVIYGKEPGSIFTTDPHGLNCKEVIHAVTMRYPGTFSRYKNVEKVLESIFKYCKEKEYKSIAMPLLGCGTGMLKEEKVKEMIKKEALNYQDIIIIIYKI